MDFGNVLNVAQQKHGSDAKKEIKYYKTKFEPPKKEKRTKELSPNIKKYLARVEEEKKQKADVERHKMEELLALRSQDKKASKRVQIMLKNTKSANKSVLEDAVNNINTADTVSGLAQPDEDDYGYVSQEAEAYYNKMMAKYTAVPDDPKFKHFKKNANTNLNSTKDRVKAALEREKEEALLPHKRKRKHKEHTSESGANVKAEKEEPEAPPPQKEIKKPKPRPNMPPPMDFNSLLKLAQVKQFEPVKIEPKKKDDNEPLMTKKQRREYEMEQAWKERRAKGLPSPQVPPPAADPKKSEARIPKTTASASGSTSGGSGKQAPSGSRVGGDSKKVLPSSAGTSKPVQKPPLKTSEKPGYSKPSSILKKPSVPSHSSQPADKKARFATEERPSKKEYPPQKTMMMNGKPKQDVSRKPAKEFPPADVRRKPAEVPERKPKQFPPPDVRRFPPPDVRRKKPAPPPGHKRRILDDDEEYDSEMDDFIDDGPGGEEDYSKYISEIFGYDKRKYHYADDEDDNMESSFAQQMREECRSAKIGIMEDLEDMRQEKIDKINKAKMKKTGQY